jgi:hypothetical protein
LRYRLYDIDRLINRTLSYAILSSFLVGVFVGLVVLATDVLPFSSPVAVAASTLTVAALFNPLRARIQRVVDRRFNRSRHDAEAIVTAGLRLAAPRRRRYRDGETGARLHRRAHGRTHAQCRSGSGPARDTASGGVFANSCRPSPEAGTSDSRCVRAE